MIQASDVARRFCVALDKGDWMIVAELTDPDGLRAFADDRRTWLGVVDEGAEYAHALYRFRFHADPDLEGNVGILSMRRNSSGWGVLWNGQGPFGLPGFGPNMYIVARAAARDSTA